MMIFGVHSVVPESAWLIKLVLHLSESGSVAFREEA